MRGNNKEFSWEHRLERTESRGQRDLCQEEMARYVSKVKETLERLVWIIGCLCQAIGSRSTEVVVGGGELCLSGCWTV